VLSEDQIRRNVRRFQTAFQRGWPDGVVKVLPAAKANWALAVQRILAGESCGCDVYSTGELSAALDAGQRPDALFQAHRIWDKRRPLVQQALRRGSTALWRQALTLCERCDRAIKGQAEADPWQLLEDLTLAMAGRPLPARALT